MQRLLLFLSLLVSCSVAGHASVLTYNIITTSTSQPQPFQRFGTFTVDSAFGQLLSFDLTVYMGTYQVVSSNDTFDGRNLSYNETIPVSLDPLSDPFDATLLLNGGNYSMFISFASLEYGTYIITSSQGVVITPTPESGSLALLFTGVAGTLGVARRRFLKA